MATVRLAWNPNPATDGVVGYRIWRSLGAAAELAIGTVLGSVLTYDDTTVPNVSQTVKYTVTAFDAVPNEGAHSNVASVVIDATPPQAPTGLSAVLV